MPAPVDGCQCGVYAASDLELIAHSLEGHHRGKAVAGRVVGIVSLGGSVLGFERARAPRLHIQR